MKETITVVCMVCGKEFVAKSKMAKYCSEDCKKVASDEQKKIWYLNKKNNRKTLGELRQQRLSVEKERRIRESVRLAIEMGLRDPDS